MANPVSPSPLPMTTTIAATTPKTPSTSLVSTTATAKVFRTTSATTITINITVITFTIVSHRWIVIVGVPEVMIIQCASRPTGPSDREMAFCIHHPQVSDCWSLLCVISCFIWWCRCCCFFPRMRGLGGGVSSTIHSLPAVFCFCFCFFHSLSQNQSTVAQRAETTVAERSLTSCV